MVGKMHKMLKQLLTRFTWNQIFLKLKKMSEKCNGNVPILFYYLVSKADAFLEPSKSYMMEFSYKLTVLW